MKTFVITAGPKHGQYVYLLKAENEEAAREKAKEILAEDEYTELDGVFSLDYLVGAADDERLLMIGGYEE